MLGRLLEEATGSWGRCSGHRVFPGMILDHLQQNMWGRGCNYRFLGPHPQSQNDWIWRLAQKFAFEQGHLVKGPC